MALKFFFHALSIIQMVSSSCPSEKQTSHISYNSVFNWLCFVSAGCQYSSVYIIDMSRRTFELDSAYPNCDNNEVLFKSSVYVVWVT